MTAKNVLAVISLIVSLLSVYAFFSREESKIVVMESKAVPKVSLESYEYYRVRDDVITGRVVGARADLFDGGLVQLREGFVGVRIRGDKREEVKANQADIVMTQNESGAFDPNNSSLKSVRLFDHAEMSSGDLRILNEDMIFTESDQTMRSSQRVQAESLGRVLIGESGFEYDMKNERLKMTNGVSGTIVRTPL